MEPAFSTFSEPHAWLIRGLVEYGWPDLTRNRGNVPPGVFGGFSLANFTSTMGRDGVILLIPAMRKNGQYLQEDGVYEFVVRLTRDDSGQMSFAVRCPEANYIQMIPFDQYNPLHLAGFIHQEVTRYVPDFVKWRLDGGEVTWAQRAGLPEISGEPASTQLTNFLRAQLSSGRPLDLGPSEGWWLSDAAPVGVAPIAAVASLGRAAENELRAGGMNAASRAMAEQTVQRPGGVLVLCGTLGLFQGGAWMLNTVLTLGLFMGGMLARPAQDYLFSLLFSLGLGLSLLAGGAAAIAGGRQYMKLQSGVMPWVSMVYAVLVPGCCVLGIPTAAWSIYVWTRPKIVEERKG